MELAAVPSRYLECLRTNDVTGMVELFTPDGVLDDASGGHHSGQADIEAFARRLRPLDVHGPFTTTTQGSRVTVYGYVHTSRDPSGAAMRWIFHLDGERIAHLGNTYIPTIPDLGRADST